MTGEGKTREQLIDELQALRLRVAEFEQSETKRQRAETALRESEEKYRTLVDNAPVGVYKSNLKGDFLYINDAYVKMLGFDSAEEVIAGGAVARYRNPNDRKFLIEELTKTGKVNSFEVEVLTKTGETRNVILNAVLEGDTLSGMIIDITERKQVEQLLQTVFDSLTIGIYITQGGKLQLVNSQLTKLTGYSADEILGKRPQYVVLAEDRAAVRENAVKMLRGERSSPYEYRLVAKDGEIRWVMESVTSIQYQGRRATLGTYIDITNHTQAEQALDAQKELTDRILASMPNAILVMDKGLKIMLANQAFGKIFNLAREKVEGDLLNNILPIDGLLEAISRTMADRQFQSSLEFRYKVGNGEIILLTQIVPIAVDEVLLIFHDVTEERAREEQQHHIDRLASIGEVAAGVAHELNNPLASVIGYSELLLNRQIPQDVQTDVEVIHRNAQRAVTIVRSLLAFARLQAPQQQHLNINDIIKQMLEMCDYQLKVNNIAVLKELADGLPDVLADPQQLEQVFFNITLNAEQAMSEAHNRGCLTVRTELRGGKVRTTLSDDGPGIPAENLWR
ncbi:MAG: PAS domain S-box protein, partial [Dehalococcoidales bacterium]|nr:PAS domain S-box protein [Dehalococcoidales bacterium]